MLLLYGIKMEKYGKVVRGIDDFVARIEGKLDMAAIAMP